MAQYRARPPSSDATAFFWAGAEQGRLLAQRCRACGTLRHPPALICRACRSDQYDVEQLSGAGHVHSFAVPRHPVSEINPDGTVLVVVALDEGIRMTSNLIGPGAEQVEIGQRVSVIYRRWASEITLPLFVLA